MKIFYVASEAFPLIKTGGLGDVGGGLPTALHQTGHKVAVVLPAYGDVLPQAGQLRFTRTTQIYGIGVRLLQGHVPGSDLDLWLVDAPTLFDRPGNPYLGPDGKPWPDNALRFAVFSKAVAELAMDPPQGYWKADAIHCNDWQTGLIPALLSEQPGRPALVFTVHNLAYQGIFPRDTFLDLDLPVRLWHPTALEFHHQLSFIKGGLVFSDVLSTVSPTYAKEIQTPELGCGLDGLLRHRSNALVGILNGIDIKAWNPATDPNLTRTYDAESLEARKDNTAALRRELGLHDRSDVPLVGMVGRLVEQKGIDLVISALPRILAMPLQLVVLGSGEKRYEQALLDWANRYPGQLAVRVNFDERLAHLIEGGSDIFLMPSRFEPCGLNQMYSLRYGAVPIVRATGGLSDTVTDATPPRLRAGSATGICFVDPHVDPLVHAIDRALKLFRDRETWQRMQIAGMRQDFSWRRRAQNYLKLYKRAIKSRDRQAFHSPSPAAPSSDNR